MTPVAPATYFIDKLIAQGIVRVCEREKRGLSFLLLLIHKKTMIVDYAQLLA